jgi:chemotaxis protein CheX
MPGPSAMQGSIAPLDFNNEIDQTLKEIFLNMFSEQSCLIPKEEIAGDIEMSAIIGFAGNLSGVLSLHFSSRSASRIASALLGMEVQEGDEMIRDAMGEMANMVAGGFKHRVSGSMDTLKISIPSVIEGKGYKTYPPANAHNMVVGVSAGIHRFLVQLVTQAS